MNILVIGSGGREHAIIKAIYNQTHHKIYSIPGNPGIAQIAECVNLNLSNTETIISFIKNNTIELVVIGPEKPIADGLSDEIRKYNVPVFAPSKYAAQLETSKLFAKEFMKKYNIPTANYAVFNKLKLQEAIEFINNITTTIVIKADGLAAGKGVLVTDSKADAICYLNDLFDGMLGNAGDLVLIEEFMKGEEVSIFAISDGNDFVILPPSQDHKRIGNNDTGKNTGGMGAYAPTSLINSQLLETIENTIIRPTIEGMKNEGNPFIGCLYAGLMIENNQARVVEYNIRFGDPETQAVLSIFKGNFAQLLYSAAIGKIDKDAYDKNASYEKCACCIILASDGYPDVFETGKEISNCSTDDDRIHIYHSGTKIKDDKLVTAGGRVLGITGIGDDIKEAIDKAYLCVSKIDFENIYYRTDIAAKELLR